MNAANETQMLANGFTKVPNSSNLFVHDYYEGLLFRITATEDEAAACGGVFCFGSTIQVGYFGIDAIAVTREGKLGQLRLPSEVIHTPDNDPRRAQWSTNDPASYPPGPWGCRTIGFSMLLTVKKTARMVGSGASAPTLFCGMVSKADRGCFLRATGASKGSAIAVTHKFGVPVKEWVNAGRTADEIGTYGKTGSVTVFPELVRFEYPALTGYISYVWSVDKKGLLTNSKEHFMKEFAPDTDGEIIQRYSAAFDKLIGGATGKILDGVTMQIRQSAGSSKFALTPSLGTTQRLSRPWTQTTSEVFLRKSEKLPYEAGATTGSTGALDITVEGNVGGFADASGVPTAEVTAKYVSAGYSDASGTFNELASGSFTGVAPFSLRFVPYTHVDMGFERVIPVGNCIGFYSPRSGPGASVGPNGEKVVLDLSARVEEELERMTGNGYGGGITGGGTEEEQIAKVDAALSSEAERRAAVERALPHFSPYAAFIMRAVNFLDAEVAKN